jgi:hypothetical protein
MDSREFLREGMLTQIPSFLLPVRKGLTYPPPMWDSLNPLNTTTVRNKMEGLSKARKSIEVTFSEGVRCSSVLNDPLIILEAKERALRKLLEEVGKYVLVEVKDSPTPKGKS